jgi:hypothetical protein
MPAVSRRVFTLGLSALALAPFAQAAPPAGVLPRAAWKALDAKPGGRVNVPTRFTLHHTAGPQADSASAPATLRGIQAFHMKEKGWIDIAYHVFVDADGKAWEGRSPEIVGDTATTYDPSGFYLVCALGNFEKDTPTAAQLEGIAQVLATVHHERGLPIDTLAPHRDLAATLCPGKNLVSRMGGIVTRAVQLAGVTP